MQSKIIVERRSGKDRRYHDAKIMPPDRRSVSDRRINSTKTK
jgi:hypothetical protein